MSNCDRNKIREKDKKRKMEIGKPKLDTKRIRQKTRIKNPANRTSADFVVSSRIHAQAIVKFRNDM